MKYVINPFTAIPANPKSHVRGWSEYWAESIVGATVLGKDLSCIDSDDIVFIDHGVNFAGSLNLFGGVDEDLVDRLLLLTKIKPKVVSLDITMPDYVAQLHKRIGQNTCSKRLNTRLLNRLSDWLSDYEILTWDGLKKKDVCIGDSHATAFAKRHAAVCRTNGQTLYGFLKANAEKIQIKKPRQVKRVTLCFGSIDIRHHIFRQRQPYKALEMLVDQYVDFSRRLAHEWGVAIEFAAPVPVEFEGRRIPKSGFYEGTPFFGSLAQRKRATERFIGLLEDKHHQIVVSPPPRWYGMDPEQYAKEIMELGSSVHIAPTNYRSRGGWDVI